MRKRKVDWRTKWRMSVSAAEAPADAQGEWTPELVFARLCEGVRVAEVCMRHPAPSSRMVATLETWRELNPGMAEGRTKRKAATPAQVSMMEETLGWLKEHVRCGKARSMLAWLVHIRACGGNFRAVCKAQGWGKSQAYETCNINLRAIAGTLNRRKVPVRV